MVPEAFIAAFEDTDDVELTIASYAETPMWKDLNHEYGKHPKIRLVATTHVNPIAHYDKQHVLVSPHLAEGWGLCIPEAMALGMPCIVSRCSAPRDYFRSEFGWWIEMSDLYLPVSGCLNETPGFWRLPDINDLADKMRIAYENREECTFKGKRAAEYAQTCLTWECGAEKALRMIQGETSGND